MQGAPKDPPSKPGFPLEMDNAGPADLRGGDRGRRRLDGVAHRTPVLTSRTADAMTGARLFFKAENLQRGGAFKFRGAYNAISALPEAVRARGVLAFSSGNHAQAIALASRLLGVPAVIVMPEDPPAVKIEATRGYGAEVVSYDRYSQDREALGREIAQARGLSLIPPYDHPHVIAGQGTLALELIEETGPLDMLVACLGGGGQPLRLRDRGGGNLPRHRRLRRRAGGGRRRAPLLPRGPDRDDPGAAHHRGWRADHLSRTDHLPRSFASASRTS